MSSTPNTPRQTKPCPPHTRTHLGRTWQRTSQPLGPEPSLTRAEFAADCDINNILKKYQRTGAINHFAKYSPQYGDFTPLDLQQAHAVIIQSREMFAALPSSIRDLVRTPEGFLEFVQDPKNKDKMAELGLIQSEAPLIPVPPSTPAA